MSAAAWPGSVFDAARACLEAGDAGHKVELTRRTAAHWRAGELNTDARSVADAVRLEPGIPATVRLVDPLAVPKRKLGTPDGMAAFVHAIAHIEFNAINLAWDCVYRFRDMPREFTDDWIGVAADEAEHFVLLRTRLAELGHDYGDFEAHNGLWEMAEKTAHDLLARMAMVPRVLEARGLDVTPGMIRRLERLGDERTIAILEVILAEEVAHVAAGSRWYRHTCEQRGLDADATFRELVDEYLAGKMKGPFNTEDRRRAGFSDGELALLDSLAAARG